MVSELPADIPAAVFVVLHIPPEGTSVLPGILSRAGPLSAVHAVDGDPIRPGTITVAPADNHLILERDRIRVVRGPRENGHRPAIDPLFRTAARVYRSRVSGVILSGSLDDGTAGLRTIKICGGATLVQDPAEAFYPSMPHNAIATVDPDYVLPVARLAEELAKLAASPIEALLREEEVITMTEEERPRVEEDPQPGRRSAFACPECGGALWEVDTGEFVHFRCRVGHAFSDLSLLAVQGQALETALWTALRALEERAAMNRRIALRASGRGQSAVSSRHLEQAHEADDQAAVVRRVLETFEAAATPDRASESDLAAS
jgi:two-component system chemotaxis response regulator CheB